MNNKKRNKGAALVSVLIATTFMTVLISTLLYMAYMNYLTKSMRYMSTDNFYTDEFALDDLATSMQEYAADAAALGVTDGRTDLVAATSSDGGHTWNSNALKNMIQVASKEADIEVSAANGINTMVVTSKSVTYKNVKLTSKTKKGAYESNIVSDIKIVWPDQPKKSFGIYDFSLITDQQIHVKSGQVNVGGCLYCRQQTDDGQTWAIKVGNKGILNLSCPIGIVDGNIIVEAGGCMCISGEMYVTGNITIEPGGMAFVTGSMEYAGTLTGGDRIKGKDTNVKQHAGSDAERQAWANEFKNLAGTKGVAGGMVNTHYRLLDPGSSTHWFYADDTVATGRDELYIFSDGSHWGQGGSKKSKTPCSNGKYSHAVVENHKDVFNDGDLEDSLILCIDVDNIRGALIRSTIIMPEKETLTFDIQASSTYLGKMTEEGYEKAKDILFDPTNFQSVSSAHGGTSPYFYSNGGTTYFSDIKSTCNSLGDSEDYFAGGKITYYEKDGKNVVPIGNLITPDAEPTVAKLLSLALGATIDPKDTYIIYSNWSKE